MRSLVYFSVLLSLLNAQNTSTSEDNKPHLPATSPLPTTPAPLPTSPANSTSTIEKPVLSWNPVDATTTIAEKPGFNWYAREFCYMIICVIFGNACIALLSSDILFFYLKKRNEKIRKEKKGKVEEAAKV